MAASSVRLSKDTFLVELAGMGAYTVDMEEDLWEEIQEKTKELQ